MATPPETEIQRIAAKVALNYWNNDDAKTREPLESAIREALKEPLELLEALRQAAIDGYGHAGADGCAGCAAVKKADAYLTRMTKEPTP